MEKFIHLDCCDSTQDVTKEQLSQGVADEITVSCEHQLNGRGRGINSWVDGPGTICFSMTISPHHQINLTALEISVLICEYFELMGQDIRLKWPNDLINQERKKCGGILVQNFQNTYVVGIGLNIFYPDQNFGGIFSSSFPFNKKEYAHKISKFIRENRFLSSEDLIRKWSNKCVHLNQLVTIIEGDHRTKGIFKCLGPYGEAVIENENGLQHLFNGSLIVEK